MRITGFVWLEQYVEKLSRKHDVTPEEVDEMRRDVLAKRALGFDDDYWHRGATLLRLPTPAAAVREG